MGFLQILYDILHRGRVLADENLSPGFTVVKQRVLVYSLLASSRVLEPELLASTKVLLAPVTSVDKERVCTRVYPGVF